MNAREEEFFKRLHAIFQVEAAEHIRKFSSVLLELEKNQEGKETQGRIEIIMREAHSLKGAARSVNRKDIESVCQVLESIFAKLKTTKFLLTKQQFDLIHETTGVISKLVESKDAKLKIDTRSLIKQLQNILGGDQTPEKTEAPVSFVMKPVKQNPDDQKSSGDTPSEKAHSSDQETDKHENDEPTEVPQVVDNETPTSKFDAGTAIPEKETVRIYTKKLDPLFLQAEQMIQSKIAGAQRIEELNEIYHQMMMWKSDLRKQDKRYAATSALQSQELVEWNTEKINELDTRLAALISSFSNDHIQLGRMIDEHVESMKKILMLPVSTLIEGFPQLVRSLASDQNKEINFTTNGTNIEIDKRILEELKDPLVHLIRNCVDHGIENQEQRLKSKKLPIGTITIKFSANESRLLEILISDDGSGIDTDKVVSAAVKAGVISKDRAQSLNPQESLNLVFQSGLTTSPIITELSGRGLGMAIVKEKVEKLGGEVSVESLANKGTTFRLIVPLTLSTFRGVLIRTGEHYFFLPTANVQLALRVDKNDFRTVENRETIALGDEIIAVTKLSDVMGLKETSNGALAKKSKMSQNSAIVQLIVVRLGDTQIGFRVDEILDEQQILIKELGKQLKNVRNISGSTVLGSGRVVPVINVSDLMKSALSEKRVGHAVVEEQIAEKNSRILVTEDSITSRTLIKDILETAGYQVETAVDGVDGYTKALIGDFDLVVSDVDMPRMNGFELTAKIRSDKNLSEIPVVLVTALESREDREHGIDVGASAYIIKSSFDQSNLLEVVKKLL